MNASQEGNPMGLDLRRVSSTWVTCLMALLPATPALGLDFLDKRIELQPDAPASE